MKTPFELRFDKKPTLAYTHPFGCTAYITKIPTSKLEERVIEGKWIGLDPESNGHRIYWSTRNSITVERDIVFSQTDKIPQIEGEYKEIKWNLEPIKSISPNYHLFELTPKNLQKKS